MAKVVTPILCTVKHITAPKTGQYGDYQSVLFIADDNQEIWKSFDAGSPELEMFNKGQRVELVPSGEKNGKVSHNVVLLTPAPSREQQAVNDHHSRTISSESGEWTDAEKRAIAAKIQQNAKLMRFCLETASAQFGDLLSQEESLRCLATSLFIQALK